MHDAVLSETVTITGHGGDPIEAYSARPLTPGPVGGVVVQFGSADVQPGPAQVAELEAALKAAGKTYQFRTYEGANHGFMQVDSPRYHAQSAVDAWGEILAWFGRYLAA
jgi:carboxymethylenebutenolidase